MPIYEYLCQKCGHKFEKIQKFSDRLIKKCPECGGPVEQTITAPAVQFKGTGWYVTDYANKGGKDKSASGSKEAKDAKENSGSSGDSGDKSEKRDTDKSDKKESKESKPARSESKEKDLVVQARDGYYLDR